MPTLASCQLFYMFTSNYNTLTRNYVLQLSGDKVENTTSILIDHRRTGNETDVLRYPLKTPDKNKNRLIGTTVSVKGDILQEIHV